MQTEAIMEEQMKEKLVYVRRKQEGWGKITTN
jgi:hypothetical protein